MSWKIICIFFFLSFTFLACEPVPHGFTSEELKQIDSLFQVAKDSMEVVMKAECDSIYFADYEEVVDSLREIRKKEILDIIGE